MSRALNDKGEIDGSTKQRVLDAARELGYRPSRFARGLVRQDSTTIGLVIPDLLNPFFPRSRTVRWRPRARDWHVIVYDTHTGDNLGAIALYQRGLAVALELRSWDDAVQQRWRLAAEQ